MDMNTGRAKCIRMASFVCWRRGVYCAVPYVMRVA